MKDVAAVALAIFIGALAGYGVWDAWLTETGLLGLVVGPLVGGIVGWIVVDLSRFLSVVRAALRRCKLPVLYGVDYGCAVAGFFASVAFVVSLFVVSLLSFVGLTSGMSAHVFSIVVAIAAGGAAFGLMMGFLIAFLSAFDARPSSEPWKWSKRMLANGNVVVWSVWVVRRIVTGVRTGRAMLAYAHKHPTLTKVALKKAGTALAAVVRDVVYFTISRCSVTAATFSAIFALASIIYGHPFWMALIGATVGAVVYRFGRNLVDSASNA